MSLLEALASVLQLVKEFKQKEKAPQSQKAEALKQIVDKLRPHLHHVDRPIYLQRRHDFTEEYQPKSLYPRITEFDEESEEYKERGLLLYDQVWLLRSGRFLLVKTAEEEHTEAYYSGYADTVLYPATWTWRGEAVETADPPDLPMNVGQVVNNISLAVSKLLCTVKDVRESQRGAFAYILKELWGKGTDVDDAIVELLAGLPSESLYLDPEDVNLLIEALLQHRWAKREQITEYTRIHPAGFVRVGKALANLGRHSMDPLVRALENEDEDLRIAAIDVLGEIGSERAVQELRKVYRASRWGSTWAGYALVRIGDYQAFVTDLKDPERFWRFQAAHNLGAIGNERAAPALIQVYKDDPDKEIRELAGKILDRWGKRPRSWREKLFRK